MSPLEVGGGIALGVCFGLTAAVFLRMPTGHFSRPLLAFLACTGLWGIGDVISTNAEVMLWKQVGLAVLYSGAIFLPSFWWLLAVRWGQGVGCPLPVIPRRWRALPLLWPALLWVAMLTNPWHGRFITPVIGGPNEYQTLWWWMAVPNYGLVVAALGLEIWVMRRVRTPEVRNQGVFLIAASLLTMLSNLFYVMAGAPNGTLLVLAISGTLLLVGMHREGLFGVLPVALPVIADHDPHGVLVVRPDGRVAYRNERIAELFAPLRIGLESRFPAVVGEQLREPTGVRLAARGPGWEGALWETLAQPDGMLLRYGRDGRRWLRMTGQAVLGRNRACRALCVRVRDVTDEQRSQTAARRADRLESVAELAASVGRDFADFLEVIASNAQLLETSLQRDPATGRKLARILDATRSAHELSEQLRLHAGGVGAKLETQDLSEAILAVAGRFGGAPGDRVRLRLDFTAEPLIVEADTEVLSEALCELVQNARDALAGDGEIQLRTGRRFVDPSREQDLVAGQAMPAGNYAFVRIEDSGEGMTPDVQERIFEPFFSTREKRRGLGLSSVFGAVRAQGGLLSLVSQPGRGSTFTLFLPAEVAAAPAGGEEPPHRPVHGTVRLTAIEGQADGARVGRAAGAPRRRG